MIDYVVIHELPPIHSNHSGEISKLVSQHYLLALTQEEVEGNKTSTDNSNQELGGKPKEPVLTLTPCMQIMTNLQTLAISLSCALIFTAQGALCQAKGIETADRYAEAKKEMSEDVYLVYRLLERIMQTNAMTESVGITVRSTTPEECYRLTGNRELCAIVGDLPDMKAKDSLYAWALQVVSSSSSMPNASADGQNNVIRIQKSLNNALSDKPMALACVVGHELAHIALKHRKEKAEKSYELDREASTKISSAIRNAKRVQHNQQIFAAIAMGLNAGAGTYQGALNNYQLAASMQTDNAEGGRALEFIRSNYDALRGSAPQSVASLESMSGLGAGLIRRTMKDINQYLDVYRDQLMSFSRRKEMEADVKAMEYIANAGIDPKACLDVVEILHRSSPVKTTSAEDSHPGENERKSQMEKSLSEMPNQLRYRYKVPQTRLPILPYVYDADTQIVRISPAGTEGLQAGKNNKTKAVEAILGK